MALLWAIVLSVLVVLVESVAGVRATYGWELRIVELVFTGLFTVEYILRLLSVKRLVDLLSILPTFVEILLPGAASLSSRAHASVASGFQSAETRRVFA